LAERPEVSLIDDGVIITSANAFWYENKSMHIEIILELDSQSCKYQSRCHSTDLLEQIPT